jgi:hypothetical protein
LIHFDILEELLSAFRSGQELVVEASDKLLEPNWVEHDTRVALVE